MQLTAYMFDSISDKAKTKCSHLLYRNWAYRLRLKIDEVPVKRYLSNSCHG